MRRPAPGPYGPVGYCCGHETHLRSLRVGTHTLSNPPKTADRWVVVVRWQCHIDMHHNGEWWYTSDNPDEPMP